MERIGSRKEGYWQIKQSWHLKWHFKTWNWHFKWTCKM